jgi:hypothetical protein
MVFTEKSYMVSYDAILSNVYMLHIGVDVEAGAGFAKVMLLIAAPAPQCWFIQRSSSSKPFVLCISIKI